MQLPARKSLMVWLYILLLTLATGAVFFLATPSPQDDFVHYQKFIETLAGLRLDLSIPGFHGSDIFGFIVYVFTRSPIAEIYGLIIAALFLPLLGFLAGRSLFRNTWHGIALATIVTMMPFVSFVCLRGWTGPGYWFWMLLTIFLAAERSKWTGIPWALAILTKPFAIIFLPLIYVIYQPPSRNSKPATRNFWWVLLTAAAMIILYMIIQYTQAGRIIVGAHSDVTAGGILQSPKRIIMNLAHSLQMLFSVHNYYFPNPALTGPGNLMHTSPVLIFLGLFGLLAPKNYWPNLRLPLALLGGAALGIAMNALLDHMDHFYMEASILLLIIAALPVLKKHPLWIPIALATLHFQWLYFYLQFRTGFGLGYWFFLIPLVVDICVSVWFLLKSRRILEY
ncbi:MAG: hypothetical protein HOO67_04600 [Candidatus Peribacteraceae bacterium]|nr:hypothetical protein [Candidatus Peribacteraceae bacterium]